MMTNHSPARLTADFETWMALIEMSKLVGAEGLSAPSDTSPCRVLGLFTIFAKCLDIGPKEDCRLQPQEHDAPACESRKRKFPERIGRRCIALAYNR